jgi:4-amino-4-deoxy-L-arabinose transferase-like glycosyltransferase
LRLLAAAVLVYLLIAGALIAAGPGPNYDEALFQFGAVQMLSSREPPPIIQPQGWLPFAGRSWPVMVMPYAGAVSYYFLLPVFAVFGPGLVAARVAVAVLAAFGLWGLGRLVGVATGPRAAAVAVLALAVHPGFVSNTAFNDSGFAYWMAAIGAAGLALRGYLERRTAAWAAAVGLACGFGVWTRLNFAWLIGALVLGVLAAFGRRAIPSAKHLAAAAAGAVVGSAPLLVFQALTRGRVTLAFMSGFDAEPRTVPVLVWRTRLLLSSLLYDGEHRQVLWDGPPALPLWQLELTGVIVAASILTAFVGRTEDGLRRWHRAVSVCFLVLAAVMIATRLPVRGHHFVTLVPLAAVAAVLAALRLLGGRPSLAPAVALVGALYFGTAVYWDWAARRGLLLTGGAGVWSDATTAVARYLDARGGPPVRIMDWGFHLPFVVLTNGRVPARELFWWDPYGPQAPVWQQEIVPGGLYLTHADAYLSFPKTTARYRVALARSGLSYSTIVFNDRRGRPHSELVEVAP